MNPEHFCLLVAMWEILVGSALLIGRDKFLRWAEKAMQNTAKTRFFISAWLAIGALAVSSNPYPAWNLLGLLSILAWVTMIKCAVGVLYTDLAIKWSLVFMRKTPIGVGVVVLGIGGLLFNVLALLQS